MRQGNSLGTSKAAVRLMDDGYWQPGLKGKGTNRNLELKGIGLSFI